MKRGKISPNKKLTLIDAYVNGNTMQFHPINKCSQNVLMRVS